MPPSGGRKIPSYGTMNPIQDYNGVMDNIMQQLLSRELMYDPIKQVRPSRLPAADGRHFKDCSVANKKHFARSE